MVITSASMLGDFFTGYIHTYVLPTDRVHSIYRV